jgi:hypothetical protein
MAPDQNEGKREARGQPLRKSSNDRGLPGSAERSNLPAMTNDRLLLAVVLVGVAACSDNNLPNALFANQVDTIVIGSIIGTPLNTPSGFSVLEDRLVRTDQSAGFDFAFLDDGVTRALLPLDVFGLGGRSSNPGVIRSTSSFEALLDPPTDGYLTTDTVAVAVGDVFVVRSRLCFLSVPQYGKLEVLELNTVDRLMTFKVMSNVNCGYRSLAPGVPTE